jgi:carboxyl-terminal processing protease
MFPATLLAEDLNERQQTYKDLETFANVLTLLQQHYVEKIDTNEVIIGAINGMLTSLDPHSSYMQPEDFKELQEETKGSFSGIGIEITIRDGILTVVSPIEETPAFKQSIEAGDQIIRINDKSTKDMGLMKAVKKLRGKKGTKVSITIHRPGGQALKNFTLTRDVIPLHSVKSMQLGPGLIYVRITNFQATTTRDVREVLNKASSEKETIQGVVLDLRSNPGGLLDQAVKVSDIFLDKGVIVSTKGRDTEQNMVFEAHSGSGNFTFPMVVLVNGGSASASEIVAGALQDHGRAIIIGTVTFGKGSVQTIIPMPNGAGIRLTTARYYTPSGDSIQETGITPDVVVPFQEVAKKTKIERPWEIREKDLPGHFSNGNGKKEADQKSNEHKDKKQQKIKQRLARDNQLRTALIILKSLNIVGHSPKKMGKDTLKK